LRPQILKLTTEGQWSWWRVLPSRWTVLGQNILYVVGLAWPFIVSPSSPEEKDITIREGPSRQYEFAAMLCFLLFVHNLLAGIDGGGIA
jgi:hypothetical protein